MTRGEKLTEAIKCVMASRRVAPSIRKAEELLKELFPVVYSKALLDLAGQNKKNSTTDIPHSKKSGDTLE